MLSAILGRAPYDAIISLGSRCQSAFQIRRLYPSLHRAHFFDWLVAPAPSVSRMLNNSFEGFADLEHLRLAPSTRPEFDHQHILQTRYGVLITHDFPAVIPYNEHVPRFAEKCSYLRARWAEGTQPGHRVLFIHQCVLCLGLQGFEERNITLVEADTLHRAAAKACPELDFDLLVITDERVPAEDWSTSLAIHFAMPQSGKWYGDSTAWDALMAPVVLSRS
jgi:hypothetical protein